MAKRRTLMDEFREELKTDQDLNQIYQRELAKLKLANQILAARQHAPESGRACEADWDSADRGGKDGERRVRQLHRHHAGEDRGRNRLTARGASCAYGSATRRCEVGGTVGGPGRGAARLGGRRPPLLQWDVNSTPRTEASHRLHVPP